MTDANIFKSSAYLLYKNPILFVLPSVGSIISIVFEAFYLVGLRNNTQNYFPFSDMFVLLFLFFISFTIAYFQLIMISRKIIPKRGFGNKNKNYYNIIIFELLVIYSLYALILADTGGYETEMREKLASSSVKTSHFSIYISKISIQNDSLFASIISFGIPLVFLLSIVSLFFNAWMVQYILLIAADETRTIRSSSIVGPYQSLRNIVILTVQQMDKDTKKNIALLFILSILISVIGFVLTDIAVIPVADGLSLYILQFAILNVIEAIYSPFFLVCLFLTFMSRPFHIDDNNILHF
jgi:hypothetical protein